MADEQTNIATEQVETKEETQGTVSNDISTSLMDAFLNDTVVKLPENGSKNEEQKQEEQKPEAATEQQKINEETEEVFDESDYLNKNFGWKSRDEAIQQIKELQEKSKGFEWKNDTSKQIAELINEGKEDDLLEHLYTKKQLDKLSKADIEADKNLAAELVKFGIKNENKNLTQEDVEFLFNEKYSTPTKPVQRDDELDEDYSQRVNAWQAQVQNIERKMIIEAKIQQPKLSQLQSELVLPQIKKEEPQTHHQPSQQELEAFENEKRSFSQSFQQTLNSFNGFSAQYKDKDVDIAVNYVPSVEEKATIESDFKRFTDAGFDANILFAERWYDATSKSFKVDQIIKDYSRLIAGEKAEQKLVTDAVGKRMEAYLKEKKQTNVNQTNNGTFVPKEPKSKEEAITNAWLSV